MKRLDILAVMWSVVFIFVVLPCIPLGMAIYDLVIAFPSRNTHVGTLTSVHTREHCSDDGCSWTVIEVFQKANSTRTCEIESEMIYEHSLLGNRSWNTANDASHCYDEIIRKSYLPPAIVWFVITGMVILFLFFFLCGKQTRPERDYEAICENAFTASPLTNDIASNMSRGDGYKAMLFDIESGTVAR
jgi:hypothetical protein